MADDGWDDMVKAFRSHGLPTPPVPPSFRSELVALDRWFWGTRPDWSEDPMELYFFGPDLVHRLMTGDAPDHVTVCHSGHGINSYMITYCLVYRGLVLLTQVGWGGVYMNKEVQRQALAKVFQGCQALIDRLEARGGAPTAARERRLVCLDSAGRRVATCRWVRTEEVDRRSPAQPVERGTALAVADGLLREE